MVGEGASLGSRECHDVSACDKLLPDVLVGAPRHEKTVTERDHRKFAIRQSDVGAGSRSGVINLGLNLTSGASTAAKSTAAGRVVERNGGGAHSELGESRASGR